MELKDRVLSDDNFSYYMLELIKGWMNSYGRNSSREKEDDGNE
jgi:hypothetical protein